MERITKRDLQGLINRLNRLTDSPEVPYLKGEDGRYHAQIGCFHLSQAYGGFNLERMHNDAGGVTTPLNTGHIPARDLYNRIHAFINGICHQQDAESDARQARRAA